MIGFRGFHELVLIAFILCSGLVGEEEFDIRKEVCRKAGERGHSYCNVEQLEASRVLLM